MQKAVGSLRPCSSCIRSGQTDYRHLVPMLAGVVLRLLHLKCAPMDSGDLIAQTQHKNRTERNKFADFKQNRHSASQYDILKSYKMLLCFKSVTLRLNRIVRRSDEILSWALRSSVCSNLQRNNFNTQTNVELLLVLGWILLVPVSIDKW